MLFWPSLDAAAAAPADGACGGVVSGTIHFLERTILGLDYEIRGIENLPREGSYILAAKHQSAWETMKLHLLINDPAIILKRELLWVPIWGWYAAKAKMIAVDRSARGRAIASMVEGAKG